jgi:hypothetical protein
MQLMFGAALFSRPGLSASRFMGFRIAPRGIGAAPRRLMRLKCFKQQWISKPARSHAALCGVSASLGAAFCPARASGGCELPSVCRNAPEVCRKTFGFERRPPGMQLKPFNRRPISCHGLSSQWRRRPHRDAIGGIAADIVIPGCREIFPPKPCYFSIAARGDTF